MRLTIEYVENFVKNNSEGKAEELFEKTKFRDDIKTNYCKENNIELLRISYKDIDKITEILEDMVWS